MANQDLSLLTSVIESANEQIPTFVRQCLINCSAQTQQIEHPLDQDVINNLKNIEGSLRDSDDDYQIFMFVDQIKELWKMSSENQLSVYDFSTSVSRLLKMLLNTQLHMVLMNWEATLKNIPNSNLCCMEGENIIEIMLSMCLEYGY